MKELEQALKAMGFKKIGEMHDEVQVGVEQPGGNFDELVDALVGVLKGVADEQGKEASGLRQELGAGPLFNGMDMSNTGGIGRKNDTGKPMGSIVYKDFPLSMALAVDVATFGAAKYARGNWKQVDNAEQRYEDAMHRHLLAEASGEENDEESDLPHLGHALWNLMALIELRYSNK